MLGGRRSPGRSKPPSTVHSRETVPLRSRGRRRPVESVGLHGPSTCPALLRAAPHGPESAAMGTYADLIRPLTDGLVALGDQLDRDLAPTSPTPPPGDACLSGVYTADSDGDGSAERDFGAWRHREVETVLAFTPDDTWSHSWWVGQFGGDYPYRDRLIITIGLCLKGQTVESPVTGTPWADWARACKAAGITRPIYRLGHEFNGGWYSWTVKGHETEWAKRFELASRQVHDADPDARVMLCTAAGQSLDGFDWPAYESVDMYSVDTYDNGNQLEQWPEHVDLAGSYGSSLSVPEWGLWAEPDGRGDNPAYIEDMHRRFAADCAGGVECYFNKDSSSVHKLSAYPQSEARYLDVFGY